MTNYYQTNHFVGCDLNDRCPSDNKDATLCNTLISCDYEFQKHTKWVYLLVTDKEYAQTI